MQPPPPPLPQAAFGDRVLPEKAMHPTNIRRAALALEAHAHTMPAQRRDHLTVSRGSLLQPYESPWPTALRASCTHRMPFLE